MAHGNSAISSDASKSLAPRTSTASCPNSVGIKPSIWLTSRPTLAEALQKYIKAGNGVIGRIRLTFPISLAWIVLLKCVYRSPSMRGLQDNVGVYP